MPLQLYLKNPNGSTNIVVVDASVTLETLQCIVFSLTDIQAASQVLYVQDSKQFLSPDNSPLVLSPLKELEGSAEKNLEDFGLLSESTITVLDASSLERVARHLSSTGRAFLAQVQHSLKRVLQYEDVAYQAAAYQCIPMEYLKAKALAVEGVESGSPSQESLLRSLLRWFKREFFKWTNKPKCNFCQGSTKLVSTTQPSPQEARYLASRTEVYQCELCYTFTRFPRYNDAKKLLETRCGRCGEWAQAFALCCRAMGWKTRFVQDWSDHVWTEIWMEDQGCWKHCDCCENKYDAPYMYERGWKKSLTYVIAFWSRGVQDVTRRYSINYEETTLKRTLLSEPQLVALLRCINDELLSQLNPQELAQEHARLIQEEHELQRLCQIGKSISSSEMEERSSGSTSWRVARGEASISSDQLSLAEFQSEYPNVFVLGPETVNQLSIQGQTHFKENALCLTEAQPDQRGSVWWRCKLDLTSSFDVCFQFRIHCAGADGFAFVIQNSSGNALGDGGCGLGYAGITQCVAVEFDTYENEDSTNDPSDNHISVQTAFHSPISSHHRCSLGCTSSIPRLNTGQTHAVIIRYCNVNTCPTLKIFVDNADVCGKPNLSVSIDLSTCCGENAWIGFTAATGGLSQEHVITNWKICSPVQVSGYKKLNQLEISKPPDNPFKLLFTE